MLSQAWQGQRHPTASFCLWIWLLDTIWLNPLEESRKQPIPHGPAFLPHSDLATGRVLVTGRRSVFHCTFLTASALLLCKLCSVSYKS